jgi:hypothetical protein
LEEIQGDGGMKPLVEIVSHCWAKDLPQFAAALNYQVSSLVLHKSREADICLTVCYCEEDKNTKKAIRWMVKHLNFGGASFALQPLKKEQIGRRCIGRNRVAKNCIGDFVWFADVDQVFRDGIFDRLVTMKWPEDAVMIYPKQIQIHKDHKTGDERTSAIDLDNLGLVNIDPAEFVPKRYRKAIGGVQIVRGDFAREHGYLNGIDKWQRPTDKPFGDFRDDIAYRNYCLQYGKIVGVDLPGMFRIRHQRTTYQ